MLNLFPFIFRFGLSFNYNIPKENINHLCDFFSNKYKIDFENKTCSDFSCIAITDNEAKNCSPILAYKFYDRLKEYSVKNFDCSIFFIDLARVFHDKFIDYILIPEITKIIIEKELTLKKYPNFILYFDELRKDSLSLNKLFIANLKNNILKYCFIFDNNGRYIDSNFEIKEDKSLLELIKSIATSSLEKFRFKLVREINHFKRYIEDNNWITCQQFFYEGINCQKELYELINEKLLYFRNDEQINPHYILYSSEQSNWLSDAITSVSNNIDLSIFTNYKKDNIKNLVNEEFSKKVIDENKVDVLLILELIHTGKGFRNIIKQIENLFPEASVHCISILVTSNAFRIFDGNGNTIQIDGKKIYFFNQVDQERIERSDCPMCKHGLLPPIEIDSRNKIIPKLSSYEMWFMAEEAGYKIEDFKRYERGENLMPNSLNIFRKNGSLLAVKFEKQLEKYKKSTEFAILFPDETRKESYTIDQPEGLEKTASGYFAKCLKYYNEKYTYIPIPRKLIDDMEKLVPWELIKKNCGYLLDQIKGLEIPIIIMDEVNYSGKTFNSIAKILSRLDIIPFCYFPIFNFDSDNTLNKYNSEFYKNILFLSIYEFNFKVKHE